MHYTRHALPWLVSPLLFIASHAFAAPPAGYYSTVNDSNASTLRDSLHDIIDDHQRFPYTSSATDTWDILEAADEDPANPGNVITIYRNETYPKQGGGNTFYNREHSWPKSYGFPNDGSSNSAYTDAHHLFIADSGYNSSRSNKPYAECDINCNEKTTTLNNGRGGSTADSNFTAGAYADGSWETWDGRKGDVARALMYMAVRYEGGKHGVTGHDEPDLILTDDRALIANSNVGANISVAYMGLRSVLINWHNNDPVDDFERRHNDAVYAHQGNRNPFVDHPEYARCVFESICAGGGGDSTAPLPPTGLISQSAPGEVTLNWDANSESDLAGYHVYRRLAASGAYSRLSGSVITASSYVDTTVDTATAYDYVVTAVDTSANESPYSNTTTLTTDSAAGGGTAQVWINELHYDNSGSDSNEFVELAGSAGTDISGYQLLAYNGNGGSVYKTVTLTGTIADQQGGFGTLQVTVSGLQNGGPDGIALVDSNGTVLQFLSYEGSMTASDGAAAGTSSTDIGVAESGSTPVGYSLQLVGEGSRYSDFTWQAPDAHSAGQVNAAQIFSGGQSNTAPIAAFSEMCSNLVCDFDGSTSSDADGVITTYAWDFGEGSTASGELTAHSFAQAGTYLVTLTVTDNDGASAQYQVNVTVEAATVPPWINEVHYDNDGADTGEFIEVAGPAGTDLSGWTLALYNGNNSAVYHTESLQGVIASQQGGYGTLAFAISGIQNGAADGMALVDASGSVVQFLSYEGSLTAVSGPASGMTSTDIGVSENSSTAQGTSLQLVGAGGQYDDFSWQMPAAHSQGGINAGQSF